MHINEAKATSSCREFKVHRCLIDSHKLIHVTKILIDSSEGVIEVDL